MSPPDETRYAAAASKLYAFLEITREQDPGDERLEDSVRTLLQSLQELLAEERSLKIHVRQGLLLLNRVRVPVAGVGFSAVECIVHLFHRQGLSGIVLGSGLTRDSIMLLGTKLCREDGVDGVPWESVPGISPLHEVDLDDPTADEKVRETHLRSIFMVRKLLDHLDSGGAVRIEVAKSMIQSIVDLLLSEDEMRGWLQSFANREHQHVSHAVNVSVYSMLIGAHSGMSIRHVKELGVAALFHDVELLPGEMDSVDETARGLATDHASRGFRQLVAKGGRLSDMMMRTMLVCAQHHDVVPTNGNGPSDPLLCASIVRVADLYDHYRRRDPSASRRQIMSDVEGQTEKDGIVADLLGVLQAALA